MSYKDLLPILRELMLSQQQIHRDNDNDEFYHDGGVLHKEDNIIEELCNEQIALHLKMLMSKRSYDVDTTEYSAYRFHESDEIIYVVGSLNARYYFHNLEFVTDRTTLEIIRDDHIRRIQDEIYDCEVSIVLEVDHVYNTFEVTIALKN